MSHRTDTLSPYATRFRAGLAAVEHREAQTFVEEPLRCQCVLGVDREPWCEGEATGLGVRTEAVEGRPGPLRVDVVGRDRRDAAPVVDAGVEQHEIGRAHV